VYKDYNLQNYDFACCLYGCGTYCLTLREDYRLRVLDNRELKKIFEPKGEGARVDWEKTA
jgi:hypothetical protein